jgi:methylthioribulose-1-phosphate dehydratase
MPERPGSFTAPAAPAPGATDELVCELCRAFHGLGWATGTGGGISIRDADGIHVAPSGVQKERIAPQDVFLLDGAQLEHAVVLRPAADPALRMSECTPLFFAAYRLRGAGAAIHSHSIWALLAARLASPGGLAGYLRVTGLEMQKGLRGKGCFDEVRVPIIPNTARESELAQGMEEAISAHPDVDAVLVAGHGVYVWGRDWVQAKTQAESLDYLFRAVVEAHRVGVPIVPISH